MLAVLDALVLVAFGLVATMSAPPSRRSMGRSAPQRFNGIFLFDCPLCRHGARWSAAGAAEGDLVLLPEPESRSRPS
jgi:hypothetical protein